MQASMAEQDMDKRLAMRREVGATALPQWLGYYEALLAKSGGPFFGGRELSVADLAISGMCGWFTSGVLDGISTTLVEPFPQLRKMLEEVASHPKVAAFTKKHAKL